MSAVVSYICEVLQHESILDSTCRVLKGSSACIITGSGCCCFVMSLVVRFEAVSGIVLLFASQYSIAHFDLAK